MTRTARLAALLLSAALAPAAALAGDAPAATPAAGAAPPATADSGKQIGPRSNISNNRAGPPPATPAPPAPAEPQAVLKTKTRSNQSND